MGYQGESRPKIQGVIEADETYVGGKPRNKGPHNKRGRGTKKVPVVGVVERGGEVRFNVSDRITSETLATAIAEAADTSARLITDELNTYQRVGRQMKGGHDVIRHKDNVYARGDIHTNTIEGAFSLIKRGVYGTFHSVSRKHVDADDKAPESADLRVARADCRRAG